MRKCALFFTIILSMLTGNISYAQNSILAGKIVDENNKPISGVVIAVSKQDHLLQELKSDADGLYCSKLLDAGTYDLSITLTGNRLFTKEITLDAASGSKKYYIIKISGNKIVIDKTDEDPALKVKLSKIKNRGYRNEILFEDDNEGSYPLQEPKRHFFISKKTDSTNNNPKTIIAPGEQMPQMK